MKSMWLSVVFRAEGLPQPHVHIMVIMVIICHISTIFHSTCYVAVLPGGPFEKGTVCYLVSVSELFLQSPGNTDGENI